MPANLLLPWFSTSSYSQCVNASLILILELKLLSLPLPPTSSSYLSWQTLERSDSGIPKALWESVWTALGHNGDGEGSEKYTVQEGLFFHLHTWKRRDGFACEQETEREGTDMDGPDHGVKELWSITQGGIMKLPTGTAAGAGEKEEL